MSDVQYPRRCSRDEKALVIGIANDEFHRLWLRKGVPHPRR